MLDIISWVKDWKVGLTEDLYELNYSEILEHKDNVLKIDHLDTRYLNQRAREHAHIFFYSEEFSEFDHIYCSNSNHIKLHIIYDYHSSIERIREPRCCVNSIYRKCRAFNNDAEEELTYYVLYPTHPITHQIKTIIKQLKPDRLFGLSRAPGVGYSELKDEFKKLTDACTKTSRPSLSKHR